MPEAQEYQMSVPQALALGRQYYQAGHWQEAEQVFVQVLQADPTQVNALSFLGILALQTGRTSQAVDFFQAVLRIQPDDVGARNNLGLVFHSQGKLDEAVLCYERVLRLTPDDAEVHNNLGNAFLGQGKHAEALTCYEEALRLNPHYAEAQNNLGNILRQRGQLAEAAGHFQEALTLRPDLAEAHHNLGTTLHQQGKSAEAVQSFRQAVRLKPDLVEAYIDLGNALQQQGQIDDAIVSFQQALRLRPDLAQVHNNLGFTYQRRGKLVEAVASLEQAVWLEPNLAEAWYNLGNVLQEQGKLLQAVSCMEKALGAKPDFAEASYNLANALERQGKYVDAIAQVEKTLRLRPDFVDAHCYLGALCLLQGDFERGWGEYEWRWQYKDLPWPRRPGLRWDGSPVDGKTILLRAEQGLGDTLQFIRYAALVKQRGATVVIECPAPLVSVLAGCPGVDRIIEEGAPLPKYDLQAALLSLPGLLGTTLATIPAKVPYLVADRGRGARWRERLANHSGFKVGICWQGSRSHKRDQWRSVPLARFAPLADVPEVRLVCLQTGAGREQWDAVASQWPTLDLAIPEDPAQAWVETAALVCALDLVITVDTAVAHLAGALGVPVWVALPFAPDWRWLLGREDSPWYPSMRLFRQTRLAEWEDVFQRIKDALQTRGCRP